MKRPISAGETKAATGLAVLLAAGLCLLTPRPCLAGGLNASVSIGLNGAVHSDRRTFICLHCSNQGEPFDGFAVVQGLYGNDRELAERYEVPVSLPKGSTKEFFVYFPQDPQAYCWRVRLCTARQQRVVFEERIGRFSGTNAGSRFLYVEPDSMLVAYLSQTGSSISDLDRLTHPSVPSPRIQAVAIRDGDLPDRWIGLDGVDAVIAQSTILQGPMTDRMRALMEWVGCGGHLVLVSPADTGGRFELGWAKELGFQWATTAPFDPEPAFVERYGAAPTNSLRAVFEAFRADGSGTKPAPSFVPEATLAADRLGPILFRIRHGLGTISFSAVDLTGPAWRHWPGLGLAWRDLMSAPGLVGRSRPRRYGGYDYPAQNIVNGLRQIPALRPPSFTWLGIYLCLYLFVMVVVNYRVLRRLGRKEWSLFTFPAIAIVFGIGAYWSGYLLRGGTSVLHQVNLVELGAGQRQGVTHTFLGLFSAVRAPCTLKFPGEALPEYFNPTYQNPGDPNLDLPLLRVLETGSTTATAPISVWTMRTFFADASVRWPEALRGRLVINEINNALQVDGWIENPLPVAFTGTSLLLGDHSVAAVSIPPRGERIAVHVSSHPDWQSGNGWIRPNTNAGNAASMAAYQWWFSERRQPAQAYLIGAVDQDDISGLTVHSSHATERQQTMIAARIPVTAAPGQTKFGPLWWESDVAQSDAGNLYPINWQQRASFTINGGSVTVRYHLLGHTAGSRLKRVTVEPGRELGSLRPSQLLSISVFDRRDGAWKPLLVGSLSKAEAFDGREMFDEIGGTVDIKLDTGQGTAQFQPQFIQLTGESE